jgi:protein-disulfide isomerase
MNSDSKVVIGIGILTLAIVAAILIFGSKSNVSTIEAKKIEAADAKLNRDDSEKTGPTDAKVTLIEFGDFQCPACGNEYLILKQIKADYSGKLQFVFRHYPLSIHANSQIAARAAEAAGDQGKFWEMHDQLYEHQNDWSFQLKPEAKFKEYAKQLGLDAAKFNTDLTDTSLADRIAQDMGDGDALGVNATPTVYLNDIKIENPNDAVLRAKIDELLK